MKRFLLPVLLFLALGLRAQTYEFLPYGDMDSWAVRNIKEAGLLGGRTKQLYMIARRESVEGERYRRGDSPWSTSNAYAHALGVTKVSVSVYPERRGSGFCCRMETRLDTITAAGVKLYALVTGSLYTGILAEPVTLKHSGDPNSAINSGMPFTKRPKAFVFDYKAHIADGQIIKANASRHVGKIEGRDAGMVVVILQHRWEENGHIYAYRVGTAGEYISKSTAGWVNGHSLPIEYKEPSATANHPCAKLFTDRYKARNSKGRMVHIEEIGWRGDLAPTHLIIQISSSCQKPFTGCPGSVVWCDNLRMEY